MRDMIASGSEPAPRGQLQGRHILATFAAFFGVVFAVNAWFLYSALSTHTGLVAQEPYRKGLAYNSRIAANDRQAELGWSADLALAGRETLRLHLRDAAGTPVEGRLVHVMIGRPATERFDVKMTLAETAPGSYAASMPPLASGTWVVSAEVLREAGGEPEYRLRRRQWLER